MRLRPAFEALSPPDEDPCPPTLESGVAPRPRGAAASVPRLPEDARLPADLVSAGPTAGGDAVAVAERALLEAQAAGDLRAEARARRALGVALVAEGDPAGREVLEDAGTLFEEFGDEAAVLGIDSALREIDRRFDVSPRSFAGRRRRA